MSYPCIKVQTDRFGWGVYLFIGSGDPNSAKVFTSYDKMAYANNAARRWGAKLKVNVCLAVEETVTKKAKATARRKAPRRTHK